MQSVVCEYIEIRRLHQKWILLNMLPNQEKGRRVLEHLNQKRLGITTFELFVLCLWEQNGYKAPSKII